MRFYRRFYRRFWRRGSGGFQQTRNSLANPLFQKMNGRWKRGGSKGNRNSLANPLFQRSKEARRGLGGSKIVEICLQFRSSRRGMEDGGWGIPKEPEIRLQIRFSRGAMIKKKRIVLAIPFFQSSRNYFRPIFG